MAPLKGSSKFQDHVAIEPAGVEASVKIAGLPIHKFSTEKAATGEELTVTVFTPFGILSTHPLAFVTINLTVKVPLVLKEWVGFCKVDVLFTPEEGSPKFQFHPVIADPPLTCDKSVNDIGSNGQATLPKVKLTNGLALICTRLVF